MVLNPIAIIILKFCFKIFWTVIDFPFLSQGPKCSRGKEPVGTLPLPSRKPLYFGLNQPADSSEEQKACSY